MLIIPLIFIPLGVLFIAMGRNSLKKRNKAGWDIISKGNTVHTHTMAILWIIIGIIFITGSISALFSR